MNSCRNWHCCCHTIIPKKRQALFRQLLRSPAKNSKLEIKTEVEDETSFEPAEVPNLPQFQNVDEIENGNLEELEDENNTVNSNSESDDSPEYEVVSNGNDNLEDLEAEEPESDTLTLGNSSEGKGGSSPEMVQSEIIPDQIETETEEEELPTTVKSDMDEELEAETLIKNESNDVKIDPVVTNGSLEETKVEIKELKDIKPKVEVVAKVPKEAAAKAAVSLPVTPKCVEIKDKERPSTSTGASTGRYNCRNREKFHKCQKCGKMFFQLDSFVRHEKEHLLEETKPCYCTVCNRSYTSMSSFSRHLKTHITCVQCNKTFSQAEVGKVSPGGNNFHCSDCKKNSSPLPPVLQPEGPIKSGEVIVKTKVESANHVTMNNGSTVFARKSVPVFIEKKSGSPAPAVVKKVKQLGLQSSHLKVIKEHSSFLKCNECDRRFPNLTTLKNHRTLHTTTN